MIQACIAHSVSCDCAYNTCVHSLLLIQNACARLSFLMNAAICRHNRTPGHIKKPTQCHLDDAGLASENIRYAATAQVALPRTVRNACTTQLRGLQAGALLRCCKSDNMVSLMVFPPGWRQGSPALVGCRRSDTCRPPWHHQGAAACPMSDPSTAGCLRRSLNFKSDGITSKDRC